MDPAVDHAQPENRDASKALAPKDLQIRARGPGVAGNPAFPLERSRFS